MKRYADLVAACLPEVNEVFPWDVEEMLASDNPPLIVDLCEADEFNTVHIEGSIHVPRGILESACEYGFEETIKELAAARDREVILVCRAGNRSVLAAYTLQLMGYKKVSSMKTGLRGWNDYELPLVDKAEKSVSIEDADEYFTTRLRPDQEAPED